MSDDKATAYLAEVRQRADAATPGPWWSDESEQCWRLHGVHAVIPAQRLPWLGNGDDVVIPPQVMNHQILKAPKRGTTMAGYWPGDADDAFITNARTDVPRLLGVAEHALALCSAWEADARRAEATAGERGVPASTGLSYRAQALSDCARELREAITAALNGENRG